MAQVNKLEALNSDKGRCGSQALMAKPFSHLLVAINTTEPNMMATAAKLPMERWMA